MTTENKLGRLADFLYLIVVIAGLFSLAYVPSRISVPNDAHATFNHILAAEPLFRFGIASFAVEQVAFLLLPLVLYRLLHTVDRNMALMMVALALVSVPVALVSLIHQLDALSMVTNAHVRQAFAPAQLEAMVRMSLDAYGHGLLIASLFWGLWLLPFGYLVFASGFLPRILGILLVLGGVGYVVDVFGSLLVPHYPDTVMSNDMTLPAAIGEIGTCLWLLLVGVRRKHAEVTW